MFWTVAATLLTVHVNLVIDRSINSETLPLVAKAEVEEIWRPYGVQIEWEDPDKTAALCLQALVDRRRPHRTENGTVVLGNTVVHSGAGAQAPIRISYDTIDALVEDDFRTPRLMHEYEVAIALGRVLAHEIGHVLLGAPAYHDEVGLMRPNFPSNEFTPSERSRFTLSERSAARLRRRIAVLDTGTCE